MQVCPMFLSLSSDFYTSERRQRTVKLLGQLSKEASFLAVSNCLCSAQQQHAFSENGNGMLKHSVKYGQYFKGYLN